MMITIRPIGFRQLHGEIMYLRIISLLLLPHIALAPVNSLADSSSAILNSVFYEYLTGDKINALADYRRFTTDAAYDEQYAIDAIYMHIEHGLIDEAISILNSTSCNTLASSTALLSE